VAFALQLVPSREAASAPADLPKMPVSPFIIASPAHTIGKYRLKRTVLMCRYARSEVPRESVYYMQVPESVA
jgi:hypothetical protein